MSRSKRGNKGAGYEYGPKRGAKFALMQVGAETKRFTRKSERLRHRALTRVEHQTFEIERLDPPWLTEMEQLSEDLYREECEAGLFDDYFREEEEQRLALEQEEQDAAYESLMDDHDWESDFRPN